MQHGRIETRCTPPVEPSGFNETAECVALWLEYYRECARYREFIERVVHVSAGDNDGGGVGALECVGATRGLRCCGFVRQSIVGCSETASGRVEGVEETSSVRISHELPVVDDVGVEFSVGQTGLLEDRSCVGSPDGLASGSKIRGGSRTRVAGIGAGVHVGPNHLRNRLNRQKKKDGKKNRGVDGVSWRTGAPANGGSADGDTPLREHEGFWNSCSESVRQELIDSKARMHIAQNEQRAQEAKERVETMKSPVTIMKKAVALAEQASKIAKKEGDSKVMGWAQTVATSEAESLARSTPSSVPSFDEVHKSVSDVVVEEAVTPDSSLVSENENLKARMKAMQLEKKQEGERVAVEKHAAVLARVAELEKQVLVQQKKKKPSYNDIVCDGMTEWQIKDLKKKNEALEREVEDAYRWKAKQDVVKQGVTGSIWFGKQAAKK